MIVIDQQKCDGCARCMDVCPVAAIYLVDNRAQIDSTTCTECGACLDVCPEGAIQRSQREQQQQPVRYQKESQSSLLTAVKSSMIAVASTMLPLLISKLGDLVISKLENQHPAASKPGQNFSKSARRIRRRYRGGGGK